MNPKYRRILLRKRTLFFVVIVLGLLIAVSLLVSANPFQSTKSSDSTTTRKSSPAKLTRTVTLSDKGFNPQQISIKVNDVIIFKNTDAKQHVIVSDIAGNDMPGVFNTGGINPNQSYKVDVFTKPGTYKYFREAAPEDKGVIKVQ